MTRPARAARMPAFGRLERDGWSFAFSGLTGLTAVAVVVAAVAMLFMSLCPDVPPSSLEPSWSLTVSNASSANYPLRVLTIVACVMPAVVLAYQAWTYRVFRRRIGVPPVSP